MSVKSTHIKKISKKIDTSDKYTSGTLLYV